MGSGLSAQASGGWLSLLSPRRYPASTGSALRSNREQHSCWGQQGDLERCAGAASAAAHKLIKRPKAKTEAKTDRIAFALRLSPARKRLGHPRTLLMKPPPPAITASTSWLTALRARACSYRLSNGIYC